MSEVSTRTTPALPLAPSPQEWVTVTIDGKSVQVQKGTNVLEACLAQGIDISYFCYHKGLSSPAVCRQCLVEVVGQPKLVPSCYTPVADKMEIITASERVLQARAQMLEFTLVNHPVDCPICDKAGECVLQKLYMEWDGAHTRMDLDKVHKPKAVDLGPTIVLDAERCILCTRCIRVCDEVAGQHQLEMAWRGDHEILTVAPGQRLDNPYSLNTVDVCPVGALTSKDFRFRMRAWELYSTPSVCAGCSTGCNMEIHHHQGEVWRLVPRENQTVNQQWMCDEGRMTYKEIRQSRLAGARLGVGKGMPAQLVSADRVVEVAAKRLNEIRTKRGTLGVVFGAQVTNEALYFLHLLVELWRQEGLSVHTYVFGRAYRPERADKILRTEDVNPNTTGARFFAGAQSQGFASLQEDLRQGKLQALWMVGEDIPLSGETERATFLTLLDAVETIVVQAVHHNDMVRHAHVALPATIWAETKGTFVNKQQQVQRIRQAISPAGDARCHTEWLAAIARKAKWRKDFGEIQDPSTIFAQMKAACTEQWEKNPQHPEALLLHNLATATWGIDVPPVQLRFAHSRG